MRQWIVILEATSGPSGLQIDAIRRLVQAVASLQPGALYSPDRYALQVRMRAEGPADALAASLHRWREEVGRLGDESLGACTLARAEVLTPEEYEFEHSSPADASSFAPLEPEQDRDDSDELLRRAFMDPVTGLATRELFVHHVEHALEACRARQAQVAVLAIAVHDVAAVEGERGAGAADELRQLVAARLRACVRPSDTPGRLGRDQFAVMLHDASADLVATVAERIVEGLRATTPVDLARIGPSASVGIALSRADESADELVGRAAGAGAEDGGAVVPADVLGTDTGPDDIPAGRGDPLPQDSASWVAMLTAVARAANDATSLDQAASIVIKQVCAHAGWLAGRLYRLDGDELHPTDVRWPSSAQWKERWAAATGVGMPAPAPRRRDDRTKVAVATEQAPEGSSEPAYEFTSLSVPVLVGTEVVAVLEFLADRAVDPDGLYAQSLASVGISLGRVVERDRLSEALEVASEVHPRRSGGTT